MGEERRGTVPREERLAAKLRENLRRRKAQARALDQDDSSTDRVHAIPKGPLSKQGTNG